MLYSGCVYIIVSGKIATKVTSVRNILVEAHYVVSKINSWTRREIKTQRVRR